MALDPRMADFLAACQSWKRRFYFCFEGPLLRKGRSPKAKRQRREREATIRAEVKAQMNEQNRRQFRGPVSVSMAIFGGEPQAPTMVKAYLDCLEGIAYPDDRAVGHLLVTRWAPGARAEKAYISIEPLSMYVASFDYAFTNHRQLESGEECFWLDDVPNWAHPLDQYDEAEISRLENELEWEDEEDEEDELFDLDRIELAERLRAHRRDSLAALRLKRVLDQPLHYLDRPGKPPRWLEPLAAVDPTLDLAIPLDDWELPGTFWLPPPRSGWSAEVRSELKKRRAAWKLWGTPIKRAIGLDIAVQEIGRPGKDLDNLAHAILVPFEEIFGEGHRGQVQTYRVYSRSGPRSGVRVRLIERKRLEATHRLIEDAHLERLEPVLD